MEMEKQVQSLLFRVTKRVAIFSGKREGEKILTIHSADSCNEKTVTLVSPYSGQALQFYSYNTPLFFFEYFHQYCSKSCSYLAILIQIDIYIYNFKEETKRSYRSNLSSFCRFPRNDGLP